MAEGFQAVQQGAARMEQLARKETLVPVSPADDAMQTAVLNLGVVQAAVTETRGPAAVLIEPGLPPHVDPV